jgi:hypothetical protein
MKKTLAITALSSAILVSGSAFAAKPSPDLQKSHTPECVLSAMVTTLANTPSSSIHFKASKKMSLIDTIKKMQLDSQGDKQGFDVKPAPDKKGGVLVTALSAKGKSQTMLCALSKRKVICSLNKKR